MLKKLTFYGVIGWLGISFLTCQKADLSAIDNLRNNEIAIIGHGGMGFPSIEVDLPSNSFESITKAVEGYAANGIEVDVQLSEDGVLFLYHDARLQTLTDCLGCLYQQNAETLDDCRYVSGFNNQNFNDEHLVRLEAIFERFAGRASKPYIFLDLKTSLDCPLSFEYRTFEDSFIESLKALVVQYDYGDRLIIESTSFPFLKKLQNILPEVNLSFFTIINEENIERAAVNNFFGIAANFDNASKETVKLAHTQGLFVTLGILKIRRDAIEMIEMSPDFIYTDNIPLLQSILN